MGTLSQGFSLVKNGLKIENDCYQVHVETASLELSEFSVVEQAVIVAVANLEDPRQTFLTFFGQLKQHQK